MRKFSSDLLQGISRRGALTPEIMTRYMEKSGGFDKFLDIWKNFHYGKQTSIINLCRHGDFFDFQKFTDFIAADGNHKWWNDQVPIDIIFNKINEEI